MALSIKYCNLFTYLKYLKCTPPRIWTEPLGSYKTDLQVGPQAGLSRPVRLARLPAAKADPPVRGSSLSRGSKAADLLDIGGPSGPIDPPLVNFRKPREMRLQKAYDLQNGHPPMTSRQSGGVEVHPPPPLSEVAAAINDDIFLTELPSPYVSAPAFSCRSKSAAPRKVKFSIQNSWDATGGEVASQEVAAQPPKLRSWTRLRLERSPNGDNSRTEAVCTSSLNDQESDEVAATAPTPRRNIRIGHEREEAGKVEDDLEEEMMVYDEDVAEVQLPRPRRRKMAANSQEVRVNLTI